MKIKVLFLCTGNSCRSQMAEGFLRELAGDRFEAFSAGVSPTEINPLAIKVMGEAGIDIGAQVSQSPDDFTNEQFDYVITVCDNARQRCPVYPGEHGSIHWDLEDPTNIDGTEEEKLVVFREARDKIKNNVIQFLSSLVV